MQLTLLGTGNVQGAPVYGCDCLACQRAIAQPKWARQLCSAQLTVAGRHILLDANHPQLMQRFPAGSIDAILLTHFHMDHVHALFSLRWGLAPKIPVYRPDDPLGSDDLYKHPGLLAFQPANQVGTPFHLSNLPELTITPLALNHSRPCQGYLFEYESNQQRDCLAYLTDTQGLPDATWQQLIQRAPRTVVIDCSYSPLIVNGNHNNLAQVIDFARRLPDSQWVLTHISHELDSFLLNSTLNSACPLPPNITVGMDEMIL